MAGAVEPDPGVQRSRQRDRLPVPGIDPERRDRAGEARRQGSVVPAERGERQQAVVEMRVDDQRRHPGGARRFAPGVAGFPELPAFEDDAVAALGGEPLALERLGRYPYPGVLVHRPGDTLLDVFLRQPADNARRDQDDQGQHDE